MSRNSLIFVAILPLLATIYLAATNTGLVNLAGFGAPLQLSESVVVTASYVFGLVTLGALWGRKAQRQVASEQKLVKWEKEDQKLMAEVASDEVKLLKAKIDTLEAALDSTLKKLKEQKNS
jgi:uncharacterized integral membrane protein